MSSKLNENASDALAGAREAYDDKRFALACFFAAIAVNATETAAELVRLCKMGSHYLRFIWPNIVVEPHDDTHVLYGRWTMRGWRVSLMQYQKAQKDIAWRLRGWRR